MPSEICSAKQSEDFLRHHKCRVKKSVAQKHLGFQQLHTCSQLGLEICNRSLGLVWQVWQLVGFLFPVLRRTGILLPWVSKDAEDSLSVCLKDFKGKNIQEIDYSIALLN